MAGSRFWFLLLVSVTVPAVFCRHDYQYYINKYAKGDSTTESTLNPEDSSEDSEENTLTLEGRPGEEQVANGTVPQGDPYNNDVQYVFIMRIVIIVGSVIVFVVVLGCIVCCCPKCCRGNERRGFIIRDNREVSSTHPQQPLVCNQPQQQAVLVQHFPPNYNTQEATTQQFPAPPYPQQLPPQYQQQQQYSPQYQQPQSQTSPHSLQFYNPPEAPPPYEDTPPHKY